MDLLPAWRAALHPRPGSGDVAGLGEQLLGAQLLAAYAEGHRAYHDRTHLREVLQHVDELERCAAELDLVRIAAWFHDAIYDPARGDNEERSAAWAERALPALGVADADVTEVARLVRLTAAHDPADCDADGAVLCDADLAILAAPPQRYAAYLAGVRREYAAVSDRDFAAGRAAVLRTLLDRPALYTTRVARSRWEVRARHNVAAELARLQREG